MSATVELIKQDHRKVEQLFAQFQKLQDPDIAEQICTELTVHTKLEKELLYPPLDSRVDHDDAEHAQEEHDQAKSIIARIQEGDATGTQLAQLVKELEQAVSHHVEEEESKILPKMEASMGAELDGMFAQVVERKRELMAQEESDEELLELNQAELDERVRMLQST